MGDRAYTTILAWPYHGREQLSAKARELLDYHDVMPDSEEPGDQHPDPYVGNDAAVLAGDEDSGPILALVDPESNYGTGAYEDLTAALIACGLHVYAGNEAGGDYGGSWEYHHPPDADGSRYSIETRREDCGELVVGAAELTGLAVEYKTLAEMPDSTLAGLVRRALAPPTGIPAAVLAVGLS